MIGIYKITSPTGKIYIGQSVNIRKRMLKYKNLNCKSQSILYKSILKYGWCNHIFEVIEECDIELLNNKERFYQDIFDATGKNGLNCMLTKTNDRSGFHSQETKQKLSEARRKDKNSFFGKKHKEDSLLKMKIASSLRRHTPESLEKLRIANTGDKNAMFGRNHTKEAIDKIRAKAIGRKLPENHFFKIGQFAENHPMYGKKGNLSPLFGRSHSSETKKKMSEKAKGRVMSDYSKRKLSIAKGFCVLNTFTNQKYSSIKDASIYEGLNYNTLKAKLSGRIKNNTNLIYA